MLVFAPLLLALLLTLAGLRSSREVRSGWLTLGGLAVGSCLADWALLAALPHIGLSFGPIATPLVLFNSFRLGLFAMALPVLALVHSPVQKRMVLGISMVIQVGAILLAFDGAYIEPFRLGTTDLAVSQTPAFLPGRPLRILQLTDIHVEHPTRREGAMLAKAAELQPDLIVLTGDYVNPTYLSDPQTLAETRQILSQLHAPYGVYAVNGTVDDPSIMAFLFEGLANIRVLDDEVLPVDLPGGTLYLVGVTNTRNTPRDRQILASLTQNLPPTAYSLLLYHTPDLVEAASTDGIDLYLAGHTHGGQIRLPFYGAVLTFSVYGKKYEMGKYQVGPTTLYVSRGIGMEGWDAPRMRFLCPPEMVLAELGK
ncbi:MAG TPA: metallophosphoesterase [Anaerolineales bacterium]|nr:metallophosphoesterase [Anaerolineales bacterium]